MFFFKKKKTETNQISKANEDKLGGKVLQLLNKNIEESKIKGNIISVPKYELTVEPLVISIDENDELVSAEIEFIKIHKLFGEAFKETNIGFGKTIDDAITQSIENFLIGAFGGITNCIDGRDNGNFETDFFGKKKSWSLIKSDAQVLGEKENEEETNFWSVIEENVKARLGNKKVYWIRIYAAKFAAGTISCECSINGLFNKELTEDIANYVNTWTVKSNFCHMKQYFIIKQSDETFSEYLFTESQVKKMTNKAIKIIGDCDSEEKYNNLEKELFKLTFNTNLSYEIRSFIPEVLCELVITEPTYTDRIVILSPNPAENVQCYKNQFTSYKWIREAVEESYKNNKITENEIKIIVAMSASCGAINNATQEGAKIEECKNIGIGLRPIPGYVLS